MYPAHPFILPILILLRGQDVDGFALSIGDGVFDHADDVVLRIKADQVARFGQVVFVMCGRAV